MIFTQRIDFLSLDDIRDYQLKKLQESVHYIYEKSIFYKRKISSIGLSPSHIKKFDDLQHIPITTKEDLRRFNWDFVCREKKYWAEVFSTSGTTGAPVFLPATEKDLKRIAELTVVTFKAAGVKSTDIAQITLPIGTNMWMGAYGFYSGYRRLKCCTLRLGPGMLTKQIEIMNTFGATILHGTPSFLSLIGRKKAEELKAEELKLNHQITKSSNPSSIPNSVRLLLTIGEELFNDDFTLNKLGELLNNAWNKFEAGSMKYGAGSARYDSRDTGHGSRLTSHKPRATSHEIHIRPGYGCTESAITGNHCEKLSGYHIPAAYCICEIVDTVTHKPLPAGEKGALVLTPLGIEGTPLLRYLIGDVTSIHNSKCGCGRTSNRIGAISGRIDDMLKVKGAVVYPAAIENAIVAVSPALELYFFESFKDEQGITQIKVYLNHKDKEKYEQQILDIIKINTGISVKIVSADEKAIREMIQPDSSSKPRRYSSLTKIF